MSSHVGADEASTVDVGGKAYVGRRKYQFMEMNLQRRMTGLKEKIPDIQKTLDTVQFLKLRRVRREKASCGGPC